jgi:hypothetical protein
MIQTLNLSTQCENFVKTNFKLTFFWHQFVIEILKNTFSQKPWVVFCKFKKGFHVQFLLLSCQPVEPGFGGQWVARAKRISGHLGRSRPAASGVLFGCAARRTGRLEGERQIHHRSTR